ncbi:GNAT family N-acetyltransferase [Sphingomonas paeninsulae]|jgi:ribosomal-protein-alanine N-acetyltransferase|uniref:GNAT family N-acetyltransferase n=1 Tax=Sphingomonas paeninsulae TaxID=2319844 RepID=A0A494T9Y9_SPHPE|nr:GNAT family N-acetyltransferase [Sphingomonas paeninsulae]AYJ86229.1 GNAT family N-acetyltransferase [Sphingomonas paeninsulae]
MTGHRIDVGSPDDLPELMAVMTAAFDPRFGEAWTASQCLALMTMPGTRLILARAETLLGFALIRTVVDECELMMLGVDPATQRRGVGLSLLNNVVSIATSEQASAVFLEVRSGNPATELYIRSGFEKVGLRLRYYRGNKGETFDAETYRFMLR